MTRTQHASGVCERVAKVLPSMRNRGNLRFPAFCTPILCTHVSSCEDREDRDWYKLSSALVDDEWQTFTLMRPLVPKIHRSPPLYTDT